MEWWVCCHLDYKTARGGHFCGGSTNVDVVGISNGQFAALPAVGVFHGGDLLFGSVVNNTLRCGKRGSATISTVAGGGNCAAVCGVGKHCITMGGNRTEGVADKGVAGGIQSVAGRLPVIAVLGQLLLVVAKAQINLVDGAYSVENAVITMVDRGDVAESQGSEIAAVLESVLADGADLGQMNCPEIQTDKEGKFAQRFSLGRRKCAESIAGLKGAGGDGGGTVDDDGAGNNEHLGRHAKDQPLCLWSSRTH